jgi:hypothetical protein
VFVGLVVFEDFIEQLAGLIEFPRIEVSLGEAGLNGNIFGFQFE